MGTIFDLAGELILGTRFKRLGERFLEEVSSIYRTLEVDFEPSWFALFFLLDRYGEMTVSEIASSLGLTISAVSQLIASLERKRLVEVKAYTQDKRVRIVRLSEKAKVTLERVKPIWKLIKSSMRQMLDEGENSRYLLEALGELEEAFDRKGLSVRVLERVNDGGFKVEPYREEYFRQLKRLVFAWVFDHGAPGIGFVNRLQEIIASGDVFLAFKERELIRAVLARDEGGKIGAFLVGEGYANGSVGIVLIKSLFDRYRKGRAVEIYADEEDVSLKQWLLSSGFEDHGKIRFAPDLKPVVLYKGRT